jgi:hypothetical protein
MKLKRFAEMNNGLSCFSAFTFFSFPRQKLVSRGHEFFKYRKTSIERHQMYSLLMMKFVNWLTMIVKAVCFFIEKYECQGKAEDFCADVFQRASKSSRTKIGPKLVKKWNHRA